MTGAKPAFNADRDKVVVMKTNDLAWEKTEHPGIQEKLLERVNDPRKGRETALHGGRRLPDADPRGRFGVVATSRA